jgi:hypothetical protein
VTTIRSVLGLGVIVIKHVGRSAEYVPLVVCEIEFDSHLLILSELSAHAVVLMERLRFLFVPVIDQAKFETVLLQLGCSV